MDKRKNNGGHSNGGRKPKAEEQKLIEKLTPLVGKAYKALETGLNQDQSWAVKLYFEYMYGKPRQSVDVTTNGESIKQQIISVDPLND
jgi:hypothetical protein